MKIGIAYTTHNRSELLTETFDRIVKFMPDDAVLCFVDDASIGSYNFCNYKFPKPVGVGVAKNKCLEILHDSGCNHFFLFDDDCRPLVNNWWVPYTESKLEHACWTFDKNVLQWSQNEWTEFEKPNGCMLYFTRYVLDTIGGWDLDFKGYGYDHVNVSDRAFNAGLTPRRYIDAWHISHPFEIVDCQSSFSMDQRLEIPNNLHLYQQKYYSREFKPFK